MLRLILEPQAYPRRGSYIASLEDGGEIVRNTHTPLYAGARALLALGFPAETLLTMRHAGASYDSWVPTAIGELAKWTVYESRLGHRQRTEWEPFEDHPKTCPAELQGKPV